MNLLHIQLAQQSERSKMMTTSISSYAMEQQMNNVSIRKGYWFYFDDMGTQIVAHRQHKTIID